MRKRSLLLYAVRDMMRKDKWAERYNPDQRFNVSQYDYETVAEYLDALREEWKEYVDPFEICDGYVDVSKYKNFEKYEEAAQEYLDRLDWKKVEPDYDKYDVTCDIGTSFTIPNYIVTKSQGQTDLTDPGTGEDTGTSTDPEEPFERFQGWATNKDSTVVEYHSGDSVSFDSDTTLYAVYSPDKYTVTFYDGYSKDTEFGKVLKIYNDVVYGSSVNPPQEPKRNGYVFQGWSSESYKNVTANLNIQAFWDFAPIWIRSQNKWVRYDPKE